MMQLLSPYWMLLAASKESYRVWGRFDHERPGSNANHLMIIIGVIALGLLAAALWRISQRRTARTFSSDSSTKLFRELCAAHGLKLASRRLLKRLAEAHGLTSPATLFVEPQHFDAQNLPDDLRRSAQELRQLSERLFG